MHESFFPCQCGHRLPSYLCIDQFFDRVVIDKPKVDALQFFPVNLFGDHLNADTFLVVDRKSLQQLERQMFGLVASKCQAVSIFPPLRNCRWKNKFPGT